MEHTFWFGDHEPEYLIGLVGRGCDEGCDSAVSQHSLNHGPVGREEQVIRQCAGICVTQLSEPPRKNQV
jgi:hypothetical protein